MRKKIFIANWKMNHTVEESLKFITLFQKKISLPQGVEVVICPPYTSLHPLSIVFSENPSVKLGAQNCHFEDHGAYTGEISPLFLKELNCEYVLLGHSERRQIFGETNELVSKKMKSAFWHHITPVLCIGETKKERSEGKTLDVIFSQLNEAYKNVMRDDLPRSIIAYEPVWAIGTGDAATPIQAEEVHREIRKWLEKSFGSAVSSQIHILYGGSVTPQNIMELVNLPNVDGALVGGASLAVDSFLKIVSVFK